MCENFHQHSTYPANHFIWSPKKSVTLPSCHVAVVISACVVEKIHDLVEEWTCANSTCTTTYPCSSIVVKIMLSIYQYHMKASNCFTNHCHAGRVVEYSLCFGVKGIQSQFPLLHSVFSLHALDQCCHYVGVRYSYGIVRYGFGL